MTGRYPAVDDTVKLMGVIGRVTRNDEFHGDVRMLTVESWCPVMGGTLYWATAPAHHAVPFILDFSIPGLSA